MATNIKCSAVGCKNRWMEHAPVYSLRKKQAFTFRLCERCWMIYEDYRFEEKQREFNEDELAIAKVRAATSDEHGCRHDYGIMSRHIRKALDVKSDAKALWCKNCGKALVLKKNA